MVFAIDDSEIGIEGRPHTILSTLGFEDTKATEVSLNQVKAQFGLASTDEVKWNGMKEIPRKQREQLSDELIRLMRNTVAMTTICEWRDKEASAALLVEQIADCVRERPDLIAKQSAIDLIFDERIVEDQDRLRLALKKLDYPMSEASIVSVDSKTSAAVQLADVYAGFTGRSAAVALGQMKNFNLKPREDYPMDEGIDLLTHICWSFRYSDWGYVPPPDPPDNFAFTGVWPFKHLDGFGLRIHSSVPASILNLIYEARIVYMGCLH
jgi:hypothetical protein